jgi:PAS domain S-box-containing protein
MRAIAQFLIQHEDWLMDRVLFYAKTHGYAQYTSAMKEDWRVSIVGLNSTFGDAIESSGCIQELGSDEDYIQDPIASFGILEAQRHRARGVRLPMFLGLIKYYCQSYIDLFDHHPNESSQRNKSMIRCFFDRVELGFCLEWLSRSEDQKIVELQESNRYMTNEKDKYLTIFESIHEPVLFLDEQSKVGKYNHAAACAFANIQAPGSKYYEQTGLLDLSIEKTSQEILAQVNVDQQERSVEMDLLTNQGMRHFQVDCKPMLDVSEKSRGHVVILHDITERKKIEEEVRKHRDELENRVTERTAELQRAYHSLKENEQILEKAQRIAHIGNWVWDVVSNDLEWSDEVYRIFGYPSHEIPVSYEMFLQGVHPEDREKVDSAVSRAVSDNEPYDIEHRIVQPDKSIRYVHEMGEVVFSTNGLPMQMIGIVQDVTESKLAAEALLKTSRALKTLSECNQAMLRAHKEDELLQSVCRNIVNVGGYKQVWVGLLIEPQGSIRLVAQAGMLASGQAGPEQIHGMHMSACMQSLHSGRAAVCHKIREQSTPSQEFQDAMDRGYSSCVALPLLDGETPFGAMTIFSEEEKAFDGEEQALLAEMAGDLSYGIRSLRAQIDKEKAEEEREQLRTQLSHADKMHTVGQLAAGIAHEINNPAAYVLANLELIRENWDTLSQMAGGQLSDVEDNEAFDLFRDIPNMLDESLMGMVRIKEISKELKQFSRLGTDCADALDLCGLLDSSLAIAMNTLRHRAQIKKEYSELPEIWGNRNQLGQVFVNILVNAGQAIEEGNSTDNWICIRTAREGKWICVEIANSGEPIPKKILPRIFDPFFTTKTTEKGTGLGLSICNSIVQQHNGRIDVESTREKGTIFKIRLPCMSPVDLKIKKDNGKKVQSTENKGRVIVVDDEEAIIKSMRRVLRKHEVIVTNGGKSAMDILLRDQEFDVVVCDLMMPDLSGMDLYKRVSRFSPALASRFIFLTGGAVGDKFKDFLSSIQNPTYEKPLDIKTIQQIINEAISRSRTNEEVRCS